MRVWSSYNSHTLLVGIQNGTATLGDTLAVSFKVEHIFTILSSNTTPRYLKTIQIKTTQITVLFIITKSPNVHQLVNK